MRPARQYWLAAMLFAGALAIGASAWQQTTSRAALGGEAARLGEIRRAARRGRRPAARRAGRDAGRDLRHGRRGDPLAERPHRGAGGADPCAGKEPQPRHRAGNRRASSPNTCARRAATGSSCRACRTMSRRSPTPTRSPTCCARPAGRRSARRRRRSSARRRRWGCTLFVRGGVAPPDAARLLIEAFTRFNIPYHSGIAPSDAIPDPATVELFVGHKP